MSEFDLELERVLKEVKASGAKIVGLQFPEGLKDKAVEVAALIEKESGARTVTFVDASYGACDLATSDAEKLGVNLLIHFGHTEFRKK